MEINIYTKGFSNDLIPKIKKRFEDFFMNIEFHPEFKFDEETDTGFLPIKLKMHPGHSLQYDKINHEILTGFELLFSDYDYEEELKFAQQPISKNKSFLSKFFGKKAAKPITTEFVADKEIDELLKYCKKNIMLDWKSWNKSEFRVSLYFAAILAELTDGIIYDPYEGCYLNAKQALQIFPSEIDNFEKSITEEEFTVEKFEDWIE